jgi:hypothetical protein
MTLSFAARHVAAAVAGAMYLATSAPVSAQTFAGDPAVRVYDFSALDPALRSTAVAEARAIMSEAGVNGMWHDCTRSEACAPEAGDLVIRVVRESRSAGAEWRRALGR